MSELYITWDMTGDVKWVGEQALDVYVTGLNLAWLLCGLFFCSDVQVSWVDQWGHGVCGDLHFRQGCCTVMEGLGRRKRIRNSNFICARRLVCKKRGGSSGRFHHVNVTLYLDRGGRNHILHCSLHPIWVVSFPLTNIHDSTTSTEITSPQDHLISSPLCPPS